MEPTFIKELIQLISESSITEVKIEREGFKLKISKSIPGIQGAIGVATSGYGATPVSTAAPLPPAPPPPSSAPTSETTSTTSSSNLHTVVSPMVGTFYRAPAPDKPNYVNVGDVVHKGQVLCIIEAMKLFNEIESEVSGKIVKILVENAQPVEYEQPLFVIELT
ncbi:MAG: acetyl-CoA carboxylase biotin carboxyl carrier protein [Bacteroidia bacterium]|nr:acetyl-CoA carboxylase biotin carboxyl carrier protein [Bacteroidia bacterium]MDW8159554.1 acetyl-CoA carboxylase biotin carboxyl carrier protein [Bacteroidia bacterium]